MQKMDGSRAAADSARNAGFLTRLRKDARGNTLAIVGAALVPLAAMIGSGVDMSRAYMAKTRLQSACDAGALAARRVMGLDGITDAVRAEGRRFFNFNFPQRNIPVPAGAPARSEGPYGTDGVAPVITSPETGTVRVTASTRIPTSIMHMFGVENLPLNVSCDASLNFVNTDVMLVLDTTGSMNRDVNDNNTNNDALRKITALRAAVMALYNELRPTQTQLELNHLRLRYGIVPYSSTVNVGRLVTALDSNYIRGTASYQTREVLYNREVFVPQDTPIIATQPGLLATPGVQRFRAGSPATDRLISNANCNNFGNNNGFTQNAPSPQTTPTPTGGTFTATLLNNDNDIYDPDGAAPPQAGMPNAPTGYVRYQFSRNTPNWSGNPQNRVCDRNVVITRRGYTSRFRVSSPVSYRYIRSDFDTSELRGGGTLIATNTQGTVAAPGGFYNERRLATEASTTTTTHISGTATQTVAGISTGTVRWYDAANGNGGCIEERGTVFSINTSDDLSIPAGANDLNINLIPSGDTGTQWSPHWPRVLWGRSTSADSTTNANQAEYMGDNTDDSVACPTEARRMQVWATAADMQAYVNTLAPRGYTYHDIGMIWGTRMLSNGGVFAADNPDEFFNMSVNRHIIFMTDGLLMPQCDAYSAWGIERNDRRVTNAYSCTDQFERHMQRFQMVCNAARGMGITVWVIAFGVELTDEMESCATSENHASVQTSQAALIDRFRQIGNNIGALRLTQ